MLTSKTKLKEFIEESRKMWKVMKKPSKEELKIMIEISLLAIFLIGLIGYVIWKLISLIIL